FGSRYGGEAGEEDAYYLDVRSPEAGSGGAGNLRINTYLDGTFNTPAREELPFTPETDTWYRVVFSIEGDQLRAKMWPDGEDEPDDWLVTTTHESLWGGQIGLSHGGSDAVNDFAFVGVGTGGEAAPRAPDDHLDEPEPSTVSTDFTEEDHEVGEPPVGWSELWSGGDSFVVEDYPRRAVHTNTSGDREALTFDAATEVDYDRDTEVSA